VRLPASFALALALLACRGADAETLSVAVATTNAPIFITPGGAYSFGPVCNGSDCPAAYSHVLRNNAVIPNAAGVCMRVIQGAEPYLMDGYGEWSQWNPSGGNFAAVAPPGGPCGALPYSADGSILATAGAGTLTTAAGTWAIGTAACFSAHTLLLNGVATGGCGNQLLVAHDGNVYAKDGVSGNWWQWNGSAWTSLGTPVQP
jgi:hypothetical protein